MEIKTQSRCPQFTISSLLTFVFQSHINIVRYTFLSPRSKRELWPYQWCSISFESTFTYASPPSAPHLTVRTLCFYFHFRSCCFCPHPNFHKQILIRWVLVCAWQLEVHCTFVAWLHCFNFRLPTNSLHWISSFLLEKQHTMRSLHFPLTILEVHYLSLTKCLGA